MVGPCMNCSIQRSVDAIYEECVPLTFRDDFVYDAAWPSADPITRSRLHVAG